MRQDLAARLRSEEDLQREAEDLARRRFTFLNLPAVDLGTPVDWRRAPDGHRLWHYNLHYGEWALTLAHASPAVAGSQLRTALVELLGDWIAHNPIGSVPGWDPYPTSRRLVAWSRLARAFGNDRDGRVFWRRTLEPSLRQQARFLAANLEHDVPNNHLLANYRALAWVGLLFGHWPEHARRRRLGLEGLWRQMRRQVLPDGVHFERSISYHAIVLLDLLETWRLARRQGVETPGELADTVHKMLTFLAATRTPSGDWPMVNDSVPGHPIDPGALLAVGAELFEDLPKADRRRLAVFPDAGYAVLRDEEGGYLFFDAGPMGPPEVPGHGHADALFLRAPRRRPPVDRRPGCRDLRERRVPRPLPRHRRPQHGDGRRRGPVRFLGTFPGSPSAGGAASRMVGGPPRRRAPRIPRLSQGVIHRRRIERREQGWEIRDRFEESGKHRFALTLQLAPGCRAEVEGTHGEAVWPDGTRLVIGCLERPPGGTAAIERGWVPPGWNRRQEAPRYVLRWTAEATCAQRMLLTVR